MTMFRFPFSAVTYQALCAKKTADPPVRLPKRRRTIVSSTALAKIHERSPMSDRSPLSSPPLPVLLRQVAPLESTVQRTLRTSGSALVRKPTRRFQSLCREACCEVARLQPSGVRFFSPRLSVVLVRPESPPAWLRSDVFFPTQASVFFQAPQPPRLNVCPTPARLAPRTSLRLLAVQPRPCVFQRWLLPIPPSWPAPLGAPSQARVRPRQKKRARSDRWNAD